MSRFTNSIRRIKKPLRFWRDYYKFKRDKTFNYDVQFRNGYRLEVPINLRSAFDEIFMRGVYDEALMKLNDGDVVVDLGANAGYFCLAASMNAQKLRLIAVEPLPANIKALRSNMDRNGITDYSLMQNAVLTNESGVLELHFEADDVESVSASMVVKRNAATSIKVPTITLDSIVASHELDKIDLLKIDCEGAEYNIIFNTSKHLFDRIQRIVIETHDWAPEEEGTIPQLIAYLEEQGYKTEINHKDILLAEKA